MFFKPKKTEPNKENIALNEDLAIITKKILSIISNNEVMLIP